MTLTYKQGRCTLNIDKVTLDDEAQYKCQARNEAGVATTFMELLVESKPSSASHAAVTSRTGAVLRDVRPPFSSAHCRHVVCVCELMTSLLAAVAA